MSPYGIMETPMALTALRLAFAALMMAVGLQLTESTALRWTLALGFPLVYLLRSAQWPGRQPSSLLRRQIDAQWNRLPKGTMPAPRRIVDFIAVSLSAARDDSDGCDVRDVSDDDVEKDVSVLLRFESSGKIIAANFISWDMSLMTFEAQLRDSTQRRLQPVELVTRLINGRVVYLVATFGVLNGDQQRTLLALLRALNGVPSATQLRPFKCRNFIQRGRKEPKIRQVLLPADDDDGRRRRSSGELRLHAK